MKLNLRVKGILAFIAMVAYVGITGYILSREHAKLLSYTMEMDRVYATESALGKTNYAVSHSMLKLEERFFVSAKLAPGFEEQVALDVELIQAGLTGLLEFYPWFKEHIDSFDREMAELRAEPSREHMTLLREHGKQLNSHLDQVTRELRDRRRLLWDRYRQEYDAISLVAVIMSLLGVAVFGALVALFLTQLASDIKRLATRALDIVLGYRGPPVEINRHDEVGDLMRAVNRMQSELRMREQQLDISREQRFHKEKMAAIGSLAAAVAHEINNPIAAIAGIAQALKETGHQTASVVDVDSVGDPCDLILAQTKRITTISRQIAELTAPHSPDQELLDLNALVRNTCSFISYDKRFSGIELVLDLDPQIPAIHGVADHLTQVLMNLLINSADAMENLHQRKPKIWIATRPTESDVLLTVNDNGKGMDGAVLARAFEESYTTKPPSKGRGLGMYLCKTLLEQGGNRIELESSPGVGTTVRIWYPLGPRR